METLLYGKNLCNLLVNTIINQFNLINKNHNSEVYVINLGSFLVTKGKTSVTTPINFSPIFQSYLSEQFNYEFKFNVIDLIEYSANVNNNLININETFISNKSKRLNPLDRKNQGYLNIDEDFKTIYSNNESLIDDFCGNTNLVHYKKIIRESEVVFMSDKYFGLSLNSEKSYVTYLKYIFFHINEKGLSKKCNFKLHFNGDINDLNWETMLFEIESDDCMVNVNWLKSLVLDLFPFEIKEVIKSLDLNNYDFENEITLENVCWDKKDKIGEFILL